MGYFRNRQTERFYVTNYILLLLVSFSLMFMTYKMLAIFAEDFDKEVNTYIEESAREQR